jgi:hypothetical protein
MSSQEELNPSYCSSLPKYNQICAVSTIDTIDIEVIENACITPLRIRNP